MAPPTRVFTIPASAPFLPTLAKALVGGELIRGFSPRGDPLALARATVYLPTRRSQPAFAAAILEALGGEAAILPRIIPLRDVDEDEDALAFDMVRRAEDFSQAVSPTARRLVLARLVLQYAESDRIAAAPGSAIKLADELARLFDDMTIAGVSFEALEGGEVVPADFDQYWQDSLEFLKIARAGWLKHLAEKNLADPTDSLDRMLRREAERLEAGEGGPFIAAGSTGTIPAAAELIAAVARRPDGAVVLPGLDPNLDDDSWKLIEGGMLAGKDIDPSPGHPQFGLKRLLARLNIRREQIGLLTPPAASAREKLLSEAFRPAATTDRWPKRNDRLSDEKAAEALSGVAVIEAADPRAEALAIAIVLREAREDEKNAALVTPDRSLARRVAAELARWNIEIDDSAGVPLSETETGRLARLVASAAAEQLAPVPLLALLRHPLMGPDFSPPAVDALEIAVLRGPRPAPGVEGLTRAIEDASKLALHRRDPRARLRPEDWASALDLARRIGRALDPLLVLGGEKAVSFGRLVGAHRKTLTDCGFNLSARPAEDFRNGARELDRAFENFEDAAVDAPPLSLADYADVVSALLAGQTVRPRFEGRARIRILGPLEARLLHMDRMVLGGLVEGVWPPETHVDAWLNRPMRKKLGLDLPERRIGLSAHDFTQALGAGEVVLTRAKKQNGVETVASRFLQRLAAVAPAAAWKAARARGQCYLDLASALEDRKPEPPFERPAPMPPVAARPAQLSVTDIETLVRDPYSIYARYLLGLEPLDAIDADPGTTERGLILHEAMAKFAHAYPETLPPDTLDRVLALGKEAFASLRDFPGIAAVWWPRFERVARWFAGHERERRKGIKRTLAEIRGEMTLDIAGRPFKLTARADRIDVRSDHSIAIIDYKTGEAPTLSQALSGLAPQLPLEAAIARAGGFESVRAEASIGEIAVMRLSGGNPPGELKPFDPSTASGDAKKIAEQFKIGNCDALAAFARARFEALIAAFADEKAPYQSIPRPKWRGRFGRYDHLARIKEWSANEGDEV